MDSLILKTIGAVVIGRNEGQRLLTCLESLRGQLDKVVYVDSGSSDNSVENAKQLGVEVVDLDLSIPFTAARARNEGARYLLSRYPELIFIQFVDGDCEIQQNWLKRAHQFLTERIDYAVVCGRRRERYPKASLYNQLCDIEWNTPVGDAMACGGDALYLASAFQNVSGFNPNLIAGEEPELCFRLRQKGWKIFRLDEEMTLHDAAMTQFGQWWKRTVRSGYAYTLGASLHGKSKERYWVKECRRIVTWGITIPILILIGIGIHPYAAVLLLIYPLQYIRLVKAAKNVPAKHGWAASLIIGKFAEAAGMIKFHFDKFLKRENKIIEYK